LYYTRRVLWCGEYNLARLPQLFGCLYLLTSSLAFLYISKTYEVSITTLSVMRAKATDFLIILRPLHDNAA